MSSVVDAISKYALEHGLPLAAEALAKHLESLSPDQTKEGVDKIAEAIKAFTPTHSVSLSDDHASALAKVVAEATPATAPPQAAAGDDPPPGVGDPPPPNDPPPGDPPPAQIAQQASTGG